MHELKKALSDYFKHCIFCLKPLPEKRGNEHVIPENISGFWTIDIICSKCMEHFGNNVDQLAIKDLRILEAMNALRYDVRKKYCELPYYGENIYDGKKFEMVLKPNGFRNKIDLNSNSIQCTDDEFEKMGNKWLEKQIKNIKPEISKEELDKEVIKRRELIKKCQIGKWCVSRTPRLPDQLFKKSLLKLNKIKFDYNAIPNINPLIAKIVICLLFSFIPIKQIIKIKQSEMLKNHARYNKKLDEGIIYPIIPISKKQFNKYHLINLKVYKNILEINIIFWGYPSWLIKLSSDDEILIPFEKDNRIEEIFFILDFRNERKIIIYIKCFNSNDIYHRVFPAYK